MVIQSVSQLQNPDHSPNMVTIMDIAKAMVIIAAGPAPTSSIIMGPRATFGRAFSTTKNGSKNLANRGKNHNIAAKTAPAADPAKNPIRHSSTVINMCDIISDFIPIMHFAMRDGQESKNGSIRLYLAVSSHPPKNTAKNKTRNTLQKNCCFNLRFL